MLHEIHHKNRIFTISAILTTLTFVGIASLSVYSYFSLQTPFSLLSQSRDTLVSTIKAVAAKEAKKRQPVYIQLPGAKQVRAIVEDYSLPSSIWALVSKTSSIPIDYSPSPVKIPNVATRTDKSTEERSVRTDIEQPLIDLFKAANDAGYQLMIGSGYRSANLQAIYFNSLANSIGDVAANQSIARPGQSEHQTGLAVDVSTISRNCYLDTCFGKTDDGLWLVHNSYKYGFILRYPEDKVSVTGYQYEPWHFRYVGIDLATALYDSGLTLDEAWSYLQAADATLKANGAI